MIQIIRNADSIRIIEKNEKVGWFKTRKLRNKKNH